MTYFYRLHQEIITLKHKMREESVSSNHKYMEIQELKKELNDWNDKLKDRDHELHKMKTERNLFSKNFTEAKVCNNTT